jgi:hypothetical protein
MAATFTGTITRKARGAGNYIVATPTGTTIIKVSSTGLLSFFTGAGSAVGAAQTALVNSTAGDCGTAAAIAARLVLVEDRCNATSLLLRTRGDIAT